MKGVAGRLEQDYPATNSGRDIKVVPLQERLDQQAKELKEIKLIIRRPASPTVETGKEK